MLIERLALLACDLDVLQLLLVDDALPELYALLDLALHASDHVVVLLNLRLVGVQRVSVYVKGVQKAV